MAIPKTLQSRFEKACKELNAVLLEARKVEPEANYYLAEDNMHLMKGDSHDRNGRALLSNSVISAHIPRSGGGDW